MRRRAGSFPDRPWWPELLVKGFLLRGVAVHASGVFGAAERAVESGGIVTPPSASLPSHATKSPHTLHHYYCNSLALSYLAAAVPPLANPIRDAVPLASARELLIFPFSLLQPCPVHLVLLDRKHFNFCPRLHLDQVSFSFPFVLLLVLLFNQSRSKLLVSA